MTEESMISARSPISPQTRTSNSVNPSHISNFNLDNIIMSQTSMSRSPKMPKRNLKISTTKS